MLPKEPYQCLCTPQNALEMQQMQTKASFSTMRANMPDQYSVKGGKIWENREQVQTSDVTNSSVTISSPFRWASQWGPTGVDHKVWGPHVLPISRVPQWDWAACGGHTRPPEGNVSWINAPQLIIIRLFKYGGSMMLALQHELSVGKTQLGTENPLLTMCCLSRTFLLRGNNVYHCNTTLKQW